AECSTAIFRQRWDFGATAVLHERASRVETAAGRRIDRARDLTRKNDAALAARRINDGARGQQGGGVGMARTREQIGRGRFLDDLSEIHHRRPVGHAADYVEIM